MIPVHGNEGEFCQIENINLWKSNFHWNWFLYSLLVLSLIIELNKILDVFILYLCESHDFILF